MPSYHAEWSAEGVSEDGAPRMEEKKRLRAAMYVEWSGGGVHGKTVVRTELLISVAMRLLLGHGVQQEGDTTNHLHHLPDIFHGGRPHNFNK